MQNLIGDNQVKTGCVGRNVSLQSSDEPKFMKQHLTSNNNLAQAEPEYNWPIGARVAIVRQTGGAVRPDNNGSSSSGNHRPTTQSLKI